MPYWRGQEADLKVEYDATELTIGALQDIEITVPKEIEQLRASGSIKRLDEMQHEVSVTISAELMEFDQSALKELIGYDDTNDVIEDTTDVPTFTVTGQFEASDGTTMDIEVQSVYFEEIEIGGSRDEWIGMPLDGEGSDLKFL